MKISKSDKPVNVWWVLEWFTWGLAIFAGFWAMFAEADYLNILLLAFGAVLIWLGVFGFVMTCARLAGSIGSPRAAIYTLVAHLAGKKKRN